MPHNLMAQMIKYLPAMQEIQFPSLGWEDPLKEEMATHSSIPAWKIHRQRSLVSYGPWGCKRVRYNLATQQQQRGG